MTRDDVRHLALLVIITVLILVAGITIRQLPVIAAGALLHPHRRHVTRPPPVGCEDVPLPGDGVTIRGWRCAAAGASRGTIVFLHGVADNRTGAAGVAPRYTAKGFDVIAYDSRAHGESAGDVCTYGYFEKRDLRSVIDTARSGPVVLIGTSLGAAVALQEAADDPRVRAIVAAEVFSDLRTVGRERAWFLPPNIVCAAFSSADEQGHFHIAEVSPVAAAARIRVPVLLIHGAADTDTKPDHSQRVLAALGGPKRLILVPGAHHNQSLSSGWIWDQIDQWIASALGMQPGFASQQPPPQLPSGIRRAGV